MFSNIDEIGHIFQLYQQEYNKSIHSLPLTDSVCLDLLNCYFHPDCKIKASSLLHICVNNPPCEEHETEMTTNKRKWCKGRKIKYGDKEFDDNARILQALFENAETRRNKNKLPKEIKDEIKEEVKFLNDIDIEEKIFINKFEIKLNKLYDTKSKIKSEKLQDKKIKNKIESDVLTITKIAQTKVYQELKIHDETKISKSIENTLSSLDKRLQSIEKNTQLIDKKQDQIIKLSKDKEELKTYVDHWYKSKYETIKNVVLTPLKALDVIVWKPAKYAFWTFFGKYFYLIWGLLMMLLIVCCVLLAYSKFRENAPYFFNLMNETVIYLLGKATEAGYILGELIFPIFGNTLNILYNFGVDSVIHIKNITIQYLRDLFRQLIEIITNILTNKIKGFSFWS